jgi:hypothetical protein
LLAAICEPGCSTAQLLFYPLPLKSCPQHSASSHLSKGTLMRCCFADVTPYASALLRMPSADLSACWLRDDQFGPVIHPLSPGQAS